MTQEILAALALLVVHVWLLPMMLNLSNASWLLGSRDEPVELSVLTQRAKRAAAEAELVKMEAELRDTLAAAKAKQTGLGDTAGGAVPEA